jgi:hypothetical protein
MMDGYLRELDALGCVIAVTADGLEVLRPGMALVENAIGVEESSAEAHRSPGLHKKHYSPRTRVLLVSHGQIPTNGIGGYLYLHSEAAASYVKKSRPLALF